MKLPSLELLATNGTNATMSARRRRRRGRVPGGNHVRNTVRVHWPLDEREVTPELLEDDRARQGWGQ